MGATRYIIQGLNAQMNFLDEIQQILQKPGISEIWILSAFVTQDGVYNFAPEIKSCAAKIHFIAGVDNGATTYQGLQELLNLNVDLYTAETGKIGTIFHIKEVLASGNDSAVLLCGSANITPGGISRNIEAGTVTALDLHDQKDRALFNSCRDAIDHLIKNYPNNIMRSGPQQIKALLKNKKLVDETNIIRIGSNAPSKAGGSQVTPPIQTKHPPIRRAPRSKAIVSVKRSGRTKRYTTTQVWESKPLTKSNIGLVGKAGTHVKGEMGLGRGSWTQKIDPKTYFRQNVFKNLQWTTNLKGDEEAECEFWFEILGKTYGPYTLSLLHKRPGMVAAKQNNYLTSIRWRSAAGLMKNPQLLRRTLKLFRGSRQNVFVIKID